MKNKKGITLISLIITIIVLVILASVATYSGINVISKSKLTGFTSQLKIMQMQVNKIYQTYKDNNTIEIDGQIYYGNDKENSEGNDIYTILDIGEEINARQKDLLDELASNPETGITSSEGYRYWSEDLILNLKIEGVKQDFLVNVATRSIVSCQGLKYDDKMYYTLKQLPDNLYNVEYNNPNVGEPTFELSKEKISNDKWRITVSNIKYDGYVDKWDVQYKLEGKENWNVSKDLSFIVNVNGNYIVKLVNGSVISNEETIDTHIIVTELPKDIVEENTIFMDTKNKKAMIPKGFKTADDSATIVDDGIVIEDKEQNQFVWVPVENFEEFNRKNGYYNGTLQSYEFVSDKLTEGKYYEPKGDGETVDDMASTTLKEIQEMYNSVKNNKGFYIGRYEAGTTDTNASNTGIRGTLVCKKGANVYNRIGWSNANDMTTETGGAVQVAREFAGQQKYTSVKSTLCYGVQWDAIMKWMSNVGNPNVQGKIYIEDSTKMGWYSSNSEGNLEHKTGIDIGSGENNKSNKVKNIYDMAGNVWEWTMEAYGTSTRVIRGGCFAFDAIKYPVSNRLDYSYRPNGTDSSYGFRPALYLYDES